MPKGPSDSGIGRLRASQTPGGRQWIAIREELTEYTYTLVDAPDEAVRARMAELHAQADQIEDPTWRQKAHRQIDLLPRDIGGPKPGESPQYWAAARLVRRYLGTEFEDSVEQVTAGDNVMEEVGALADSAPTEEQVLIKGMNGAVMRKIERARLD